ncbi:MAG: PAS domain S-box protein, partial [Pararhodobacter sp.]
MPNQNDQQLQDLPEAGRAAAPALTEADSRRSLRFHAEVIEVLGALMRSPLDGIDAAITHALERTGRFCQIDRAQVFRIRAGRESAAIIATHDWSMPGLKPAFPPGQALPDEMVGSWRQQMDEDDCIVIADLEALPEGSLAAAHLKSQGVLSLLVVPMRAEGQFSGFLGFDILRSHRRFSPEEVHLLRSVADAVGALLTRADTAAEIARSQISLAEANQRLMSTLRALPELILEVDAEGRYLDVHTSDPGQMMRPPETLIGCTDDEVLTPEIAALNRRARAEVDATGRSGPHPFWAETARGQRRYVMNASRRPPLRPGEAPGYVYVARDVTEEWNLQREAERLSLIAKRMNDLVVITGLDHRIEWVNPAFEVRTGWRLDEIIGQSAPEVLGGPGPSPAEIARINGELDQGRATKAEVNVTSRTGEGFWIDLYIQPLHDSTGAPTGFVSVATDITAQKTHAIALEHLALEATEARARLEMAVEALPDAFVYFDAEDRLVLCNDRYRSLNPPGGPGLCFTDMAEGTARAGELSDERQLPDGRWFRLIERRTPEGGRVGMCIDITQVKEAEQRLVDIIQGAEIGTWEWHLPSGINIVNARWAEIVGYTLDELAPFGIDIWLGLVHPEDLAAAEAKLARVHARETSQFEYQLRMRHKAGHWVTVMSRGRVSHWAPDGAPEMMAGVHIDITAVKQAEERLARIIDAAMAGTWEYDFTDGQKQINTYWAEMLGYSREELEEMPGLGFRQLVHPEDLVMLEQSHEQRLISGETYFSHELRMRHRDGHWVWILSRGQVVERDTAGRPRREAGIHVDISERKTLETLLTAERDYLARLMETSASGIAALDEQGRFLYVNREAEEILGLEAA